MATIGLLLLALVVMAFVMRGAPSPNYEKTPPKTDQPEIPHPWPSGVAGDIDDFAGPGTPYGPGTTDNK